MAGVKGKSGGRRPGAGRPAGKVKLSAYENFVLARTSREVNELRAALLTATKELSALEGKRNAIDSLLYARKLLERAIETDAVLPLDIVIAKQLHLRIRRLCGYGTGEAHAPDASCAPKERNGEITQ